MKASGTVNMDDLLLHAGWLRRFAVALVKDPDAAEDIVQDTLVAAWQRPAVSTGRPWLARVARNLAIDRWRSAARREHREQTAAAADLGSVASPEQRIGDREIHRAVADAVAGLAEPFQQALVLRFFDGASSADIARRLGVPEGTVRWRLKEGIDRVRRYLDARYSHLRKSWVTALLPLLPRPVLQAPGGERVPPRHPQPMRRYLGLHTLTIVTGVAFLVGMGLMTILAVSRHQRPSPRTGTAGAEPTTEPTVAAVTLAGPEAPVRLDPHSLESSLEPKAPRPGPGEADAKSLLRELLEALQAGAYDDFVAKGSAAFKAAARADLLNTGGRVKLAARLATGYQASLLGHLRRGDMKVWLFRLEFADGGDDALAHLKMDGWQVAGLLVDDPRSNE